MTPTEFIRAIDDDAVVDAIAAAEKLTSGELRVFVTRQAVRDPLPAASKQFQRLKMHRTQERNAVLIFVAPASRQFAVVGDVGIHQRCGQSFWDELAALLSEHFRDSRFTAGLLAAIQKAGSSLAEHFPHHPDDRNELPNSIERD